MNNPLVSIIIPTFNRAHLIGEALGSVLAQTYENWGVLLSKRILKYIINE